MEIGERALAVDGAWLVEHKYWTNDYEGKELLITMDLNGEVEASLGGKPITVHRMFWFAWYTFHTNTALIDGN